MPRERVILDTGKRSGDYKALAKFALNNPWRIMSTREKNEQSTSKLPNRARQPNHY